VTAAISEIGVIVTKIDDIQSDIACGVDEQSAATRNIGQSVREANLNTAEIAQTTSSAAEGAQSSLQSTTQAAKQTEELSDMAQRLRRLAHQFKVVETDLSI